MPATSFRRGNCRASSSTRASASCRPSASRMSSRARRRILLGKLRNLIAGSALVTDSDAAGVREADTKISSTTPYSGKTTGKTDQADGSRAKGLLPAQRGQRQQLILESAKTSMWYSTRQRSSGSECVCEDLQAYYDSTATSTACRRGQCKPYLIKTPLPGPRRKA